MKRCAKCEEEKPLTEFHRWKYAKDGRKPRCKICNTAAAAGWQTENKDRYVRRYQEWAGANRDKTRAANRAWSARNPGLSHARRVSNLGRDALNEISREWAGRNRGRARALKAAWKKDNPEWIAASAAKRRASVLRALPIWADLIAVRGIYADSRAHPGTHVDHIVPLISPLVCGLHWEGNLRVIPSTENYAKNNRYWPDMP